MKTVGKMMGLAGLMCGLLAVAACSTTGRFDKGRNDAILAQLPKTPTFSLKVKDQPMEVVLGMISQQVGVQVMTSEPWLAGFPVSLSLENSTLEHGLRKLLGNLDYALRVRAKAHRVSRVVIEANLVKCDPPNTVRVPGRGEMPLSSTNQMGIVTPLLR